MPALWRALTMSRNSRDVRAVVGRDAVARVRGEEADRAVAPVVDAAAARRRAVPHDLGLVELEDRQQLDRGDAQLLEVRDLLDDAEKVPGCVTPEVGDAVKPPTCIS